MEVYESIVASHRRAEYLLEGGREGGSEGGREGGREGVRKGGREGRKVNNCKGHNVMCHTL